MKQKEDLVSQWVSAPIPDALWHYTSINGFQGIIESRSIHATDVRFLNDTEEFVHIRKMAYELVDDAPELDGRFQFRLRGSLKWAVDTIFGSEFLNPNSAQIFVASFTDSRDDLSQWRGYSHGTHGASISFDLRGIRVVLDPDSGVTFARCVYKDADKKELIQSALNYFIKVSLGYWNKVCEEFMQTLLHGARPSDDEQRKFVTSISTSEKFEEQLQIGLTEARKRIIRLAGLLKHRAFCNENEWRLVLPISPNKDKTNLIHPIRFKPKNAGLVPFIAFPLDLVPDPSHPGTVYPAINEVMLGPGAGKDAENAAQAFLKSNSINAVVRGSDIPYRQV